MPCPADEDFLVVLAPRATCPEDDLLVLLVPAVVARRVVFEVVACFELPVPVDCRLVLVVACFLELMLVPVDWRVVVVPLDFRAVVVPVFVCVVAVPADCRLPFMLEELLPDFCVVAVPADCLLALILDGLLPDDRALCSEYLRL